MIEVSLLIRAHYLEDRQVAFGKFEISFIPLLSVYPCLGVYLKNNYVSMQT